MWQAYRERHGTLNLGKRLEWLLARQATQINNAAGGKLEFSDFLRFQQPAETSIEDVAKLMGVKQVKPHAKT